jgi:uncharacterized protein
VVGTIGGGKAKPTGKIDIAVMQSLSRQGEVNALVENYGHVIVDECHHVGAVSFDAILKRCKAKYVLGLTATPIRRDGQQPIIFMQCGPVMTISFGLGRLTSRHTNAAAVGPSARIAGCRQAVDTGAWRAPVHEPYNRTRAPSSSAFFRPTIRTRPMRSHMYIQTVPVFKQMLSAMKAVLAIAEAHAAAHSIEPDAYLHARLFPDMFPLRKQVQIAADFARGVSARLAGVAVPASEAQEKSFADLTAMLEESLVFLDSLQPAQFEDSDEREIVLRPGTPKERKFSGQAYLAHYGLPQFFFHVTTVYAILRHNGIQIGKKDYMGAY